MPGFDRTGPVGQGPKTGRGLGKCNPDNQDNTNSESFFPRFGLRFGRNAGIRSGQGRGRGMGRNRW